MMFTLKELILLSIVGIDVGLALYVVLKNPRRIVSWIFSAIPFGSAIWAFALAMFSHSSGAMVWERVIFGSSLFIFPLLIIFSDAFPDKTKLERWYPWVFLPTFVLLLAPLFGLILEARPVFDSRVLEITSPLLHPLYNIFALTYLSWSSFNLLRKYRRARAIVKLQLSYLLLGLFIFVLFGFASNLLLPLLGESELIMLGPASSLIFCTFATYAVLKYRLMDIRTALQRGVVVLVLVAVAPSLFFTAYQLLRQFVPAYSSLLLLPVACVTLLILLLCGVHFIRFLEKFFFRGTYTYPEVTGRITRILGRVRSVEELSTKLMEYLTRTFKIGRAVLILKDRTGEKFLPVYVRGVDDPRAFIFDRTDDLISYVRRKRSVFLTEEVEEDSFARGTALQLRKRGIEFCIPIQIRGSLEGIICLGEKSSGDPYTTRDINLFRVVSDLVCISLENVKLYSSVRKKS